MAKLIIFGTGDIGELAQFYFTKDSEHEVVGFTLDGAFIKEDSFCNLPVIPFEEAAKHSPTKEYQMFVGLGYTSMNQLRAEKYFAAKKLGYVLPGYVSSKCTCLTEKPIGDNCFILEDNTIQPFVSVGSNVTLWSGNHIGHHTVIEDHCFITSHVVISGRCRVGAYSFLGVNATLRNAIKLGKSTLVGMGVTMTKGTEDQDVFFPLKTEKMKMRSSEVEL